MPIGQSWFEQKMIQLGYNLTDQGGQCFGLAFMALQAFLADDMQSFDERIALLQLLDDDITHLKQMKLDSEVKASHLSAKLSDLYAFFDGIQLYQTPERYENIFQSHVVPKDLAAQKILTPIKLNQEPNHPVSVKRFCSAFNLTELPIYLNALSSEIKQPTAIMLHSNNHAINLNFDPEKQKWFFIDANQLPTKIFDVKDHQALSLTLLSALNNLRSPSEYAIFETVIYTRQAKKAELLQSINSIEHNPLWARIHEVSLERAKYLDTYSCGLLFIAADHGHTNIVEQLLKYTAINVNQASVYNRATALHVAAQNGHFEVVKQLLQQSNIDVNLQMAKGVTALILATRHNHVEIIKLLLNHPEINANSQRTYDGATALFIAAQNGNAEIVKLLLERKDINVNLQTGYGSTPLLIAARRGDVEIVRQLLKVRDINVDLQMNDDSTALLNAAQSGHKEVVKLLLQRTEINVNLPAIGNITALMIASQNGHTEVAKQLLQRMDVNVNLQMSGGSTALLTAVENGHTDIVRELLQRDEIHVNQEIKGITPLILATINGDTEIVQLLLKRSDIDVNFLSHGATALIMAAQYGRTEIVQLLVQSSKIDINLTSGPTALFLASQNGYSGIVKILLEQATINVNLQFSDGATPLYKAAINGHAEIVKMLLQRSDINVHQGVNGITPLFGAALMGHAEVVKAFLEKECELTPVVFSQSEWTGILNSYPSICKDRMREFLLSKIEDGNDKSKISITPREIAEIMKHHKVMIIFDRNQELLDLSDVKRP